MMMDAATMTDMLGDVQYIVNGSSDKRLLQNTKNFAVRRGPSGLVEPFQVTWKDLTYRVPDKGFHRKKTILNNISGFFKTGQITAVMGPSGSGKSSLLGCISGYKKTGLSGSITISTGRRVKFAFIAQDDYLLSRLKIRESLMYASKLKNGSRVDHEVVVDNVINKLRIQQCANIRPKRCSGGQKKRISIALELVSKPNILILDEPTSGLDTVTTWQLINTLVELTKQSEPVAIVATIHQPSAKLFNLFNAVYIMSYDGQCIYHGSPEKMTQFLSHYGLNCPAFHNPADFVIEVSSKDHGVAKVMMLSTVMRIQALDMKANAKPINPDHKYRTLSHIWTLTMRSFKLAFRDPFMLPIRIVGHIACGVLVSLLYGSEIGKLSGCPEDFIVSNGGTYVENYERVSTKVNENFSCIFFAILLCWFLAVFPPLLVFPTEMNVFFKEYTNGWYSCFSYFMSKVLSDIPFQLLIPNLFSIPVFIFTGQYDRQEWRLYYFIVTCILVAFNASSQGLMISAWLMKYPTAAAFIGCCTGFPWMLFSGFMIPIDNMPEYFQWLSYLNYVRFGLEAAVADIYGFDRCAENFVSNRTKTDWTQVIPKPAMAQISNSTIINVNTLLSTLNFFSGEVSNETQSIALTSYGLNDDKLYEGLAILAALIIFFRVFTYFFLLRKVKALS